MRLSTKIRIANKKQIDKRLSMSVKNIVGVVNDVSSVQLENEVRGFADLLRQNYRDAIMEYNIGADGDTYPLTEAESRTLIKHTNTKNDNASWYQAKVLFNPFGTYSVLNAEIGYTFTSDKNHMKLYIRKGDIRFVEYGTGTLGEKNPYEGNLPGDWRYNSGSNINTDNETGIKYWNYAGVTRIGNPATGFVFKTRMEIEKIYKDYITSDGYNNFVTEIKKRI